jgi:hypothetical protein
LNDGFDHLGMGGKGGGRGGGEGRMGAVMGGEKSNVTSKGGPLVAC